MRFLPLLAVSSISLLICSCAAQLREPGPMDEAVPQEYSETDSGLKYRVLRSGDGPHPTASDRVTVDYEGWLDDGTEFDSSYKRGAPATFGLSQVVAGWTEGLQLVAEGGMIELEIPSELGYGMRGAPPVIPPDATLHFKVELLKVN